MKPKTLVRLRIAFYTSWALLNAWVTGMTDVTWNSMRWEQQSCLLASIFMSWTGMMIAFYDKSVWKADEEQRLRVWKADEEERLREKNSQTP